MGSGNNNDNLTAAYMGRTAVIRVEGRGSFRISAPMKRFIHQVINTESADYVLIDMSKCSGMDSTFMGVVAGIACYIKSKPAFSFKLINLSEKSQELLITLGVNRVVDYSLSATEKEKHMLSELNGSSQTLESDLSNKLDTAKTTLEAHEALVEINPDNLGKFKSVLEYLQEDVRNLNNK
jgi:anti-anti-sigma regulatory factor